MCAVSNSTGADSVVCVTVTYFPDVDLLRNQFRALLGRPILLVDNSATLEVRRELNSLAAEFDQVHLVFNDKNLGLASGLNQGVRIARVSFPLINFVLLLDQDSEPTAECVGNLVHALLALEKKNYGVGMVGPRIVDVDTGLQHGFHIATRFLWRRRYPNASSSEPISCANINGSGSLMRMETFATMGGLEDALFIDHVDTEWSFRLISAGYTLWGIPNAEIRHRMGLRGTRFWWFGWRVWPMRSASRHFYLFRNAVWLFKRRYTPRVWIGWNLAKLILTMAVHATIDPERKRQLQQMYRGVKAGVRGKRE